MPAKKAKKPAASQADAASVLAELKALGSAQFRADLPARYGIVTQDAFGVRMNAMQTLAKKLGRNHALALALWKTGNYEARTVAAMVADPNAVTPALMDQWCRDFDNWAICDSVCFKLFDRTPHAREKVWEWADWEGEFQKRAAFALLASVALHHKKADHESFTPFYPLLENAAGDERNFVKKAVSWALRAIGGRDARLRAAGVALARKLASSRGAAPRWVGKDVLRAFAGKKLK